MQTHHGAPYHMKEGESESGLLLQHSDEIRQQERTLFSEVVFASWFLEGSGGLSLYFDIYLIFKKVKRTTWYYMLMYHVVRSIFLKHQI